MEFSAGTKFFIIRVSETKTAKVLVAAPNEDVARAYAHEGRSRGIELAQRSDTTEILQEITEKQYRDLINEVTAWPNS